MDKVMVCGRAGTGKTPVAQALKKKYEQNGKKVFICDHRIFLCEGDWGAVEADFEKRAEGCDILIFCVNNDDNYLSIRLNSYFEHFIDILV